MNLRQAAQMALDALVLWENEAPHAWSQADENAITALRAALAKPEQEPVAWELRMGKTDRVLMEITNNPERAQNWRASLCEVVPLYYAPTPRKPLHDMAVFDLADEHLYQGGKNYGILAFARAIERAHGIGDSE